MSSRNTRNSDTSTCKLTFEKYYVDYIDFKRNYGYEANGKVEIDFEIGSEMNFTNETTAEVKLIVAIFRDAESKNKPFEFNLVITGIFSVNENTKENQSLLEKNTLAILFPFARAIVSTYTANANVQPLILPPVNIVNYINKKYEQESEA